MQSIVRWAELRRGQKAETVRSAPIYVQTDCGIVTLVKEGTIQPPSAQKGSRLVKPHTVHIIDGQGVRTIRLHTKPLIPFALLLALAAAIALMLLRPRRPTLDK